jgi:hypothetical protein
MNVEITKESLIAFGMKVPNDGTEILYPLEKELGKDEFGGVLALVVTNENNRSELCLKLPGGDTLFLGGIKTIEELRIFEKSISSYQPNY